MDDHHGKEEREQVRLPELDFGTGPVKWCKKCSRRHGSRVKCELIMQPRVTSKGTIAWRWVAGPKESKK